MAAIASKAEMYALYERGLFGNKLATWASLDDYLGSNYPSRVVLRYAGPHGGSWCVYNVTRDEAIDFAAQWQAEGAERSLIRVNESAPDDLLVLQGEVMRSTLALSLRYSLLPLPMRKALAEKQYHADGIKAVILLRTYMDPASFDDLNELLSIYPDSVVEFSVWSCDVGTIARRNTVFWEVRNY